VLPPARSLGGAGRPVRVASRRFEPVTRVVVDITSVQSNEQQQWCSRAHGTP
jgi:hypothetical protein